MTQRVYTARGQLLSVAWGSGSAGYTYLEDGKVNQQTYLNGVTTTFGYDGRGMIGSIMYQNGTGELAKQDYWRDQRDRITAWKRGTVGSQNGHNPMENGRGDRYDYDPEGQLIHAAYRALTPELNATSPARIDNFTYDQLGNRMGLNDIASRGGKMLMLRRNNGLNQYSSWENDHPYPDPLHWGSGIFHDDNMPEPLPSPTPPHIPWAWVNPGNGVVMQDGNMTASYNALNQPVAMWTSGYGTNFLWFGYDPLGRCVKRWVGSDSANAPNSNPATYYHYDGWNLIQEETSASTMNRSYVHGARVDEIVASSVNGQWHYHHYDARGNCILLTDIHGDLVEQYDYDAFGFPYICNPSGQAQGSQLYGNRFLFTGREWLSDLRLYDFRNRMYQPELGRFLQPDPKEFAAGDYNLYRYCHNDPVNRVDPTGLASVKVEIKKIWRSVLGSNIPKLTMLIKVAFTSLANSAKSDHMDRGQAVYQDGGLGAIGKKHYAPPTYTSKGFLRDHYEEEFKVQEGRPLALLLHVHDDVRPGNSTTGPQVPGPDAEAVIINRVPMIYTSTSQYPHQQGSYIAPNGKASVTVTPLIFDW